jgi:formylglycine-generating enzyme required for sulfatase activity/uncharacterized caspase-like protein
MRICYLAGALLLLTLDVEATEDSRGIRAVYNETRTALVIGNSAYPNGPLRNAANDASDISELLEQRSFDVTVLIDADKRQMETAMETFGAKLSKGGVGLFYFAGHAIQVRGINYLMPIETSPRKEADVEYVAVDIGRVLSELDNSNNRLNLVILDACRDNPFVRSFRGSANGLAKMDAPRGTLIAYATSPGRTAADGDDANGIYTQHLLGQMRVPGQEMQQMFKRVRAAVESETAGVQTPEEWDRTTGDFYFTPIDQLDEQLDLTADELARYQQLVAEQRAADRAVEEMEAEKVATIAEMERKIESLRNQVAAPGSTDSSLDGLIAAGKQREQFQSDLRAANRTRDEEMAGEVARLKARFNTDYKKYRWIADGDLMQSSEKLRAWQLICSTWDVAGVSGEPGSLQWDDRTGRVIIRPSNRDDMVYVPEGSFTMGGLDTDEGERPAQVNVGGFWIDRTEVTVNAYRRCVEAGKCGNPLNSGSCNWGYSNRSAHPINCVSWHDAQGYCSWVEKRLATETEWEKAARGTDGRTYPWGEEAADCRRAVMGRNGSGCGRNFTWPVGSKPAGASPYGALDMSGNVWEWVSEPLLPNGSLRVLRGGSLHSSPDALRAFNRNSTEPSNRTTDVGFRCASSYD